MGLLLFTGFAFSQTGTVSRITQSVDDSDVALVPGGVHPRVARAVDEGRVPADMPMQRMAIFFNPSAAQQAQLDQLLEQQQDPNSANYHKWLTPEQYGARFGMSTADLAKVSAWLEARGFQNIAVSRSRTSIEFDGNAGQASAAFRTPIHQFRYQGNTHYANTASPQLPSAFAGTVAGVTALNNFRPRPMSIAHWTSSISGNHFLVPGDLGTIYNLNSLYNSGIKGDGVSIAVVGQTTLTPTDDGTHADIDTFRSLSGLPAINLQLVKTGTPTYSKADVDEANLDLEWSGAIAPNAKIYFVYSDNALGASLTYVVNNNLAPVISISYGNCESMIGDTRPIELLFKIANAQGQTMLGAAGDSGAADCDGSVSNPVTQATHGLAVDYPASSTYVTGMGGTEFTGDPGACANSTPPNVCPNGVAPATQYWNGSSSQTDTSATALSYIPETSWNDTNSSGIAATGGGVSTLFTKPSWQTGTGVPNDGQRDVPDFSLTASPEHDGYLICSQGSCVNGFRKSDQTLDVIGGTSAAAPVFAGVVALITQKYASLQGNINLTLYSLASRTPSVYHDITTGNNIVPCQIGTKDCTSGTLGYSAGTGYDLVTGLGSADIGALVAAWNNAFSNADFTLSASPTSLSLTRGATGTSTITVAVAGGQLPGPVALTCSVSSSLGATTCSLNPTSVTGGQSSTLTVKATSVAGLMRHSAPNHPWGMEMGFGLAAVCFIPFGRRGAAGRIVRNGMLSVMGLVLVLGMISCGGGGSNSNNNNNNSTPLTGTVTITGISGSLNHSVSIAVTIN